MSDDRKYLETFTATVHELALKVEGLISKIDQSLESNKRLEESLINQGRRLAETEKLTALNTQKLEHMEDLATNSKESRRTLMALIALTISILGFLGYQVVPKYNPPANIEGK